MTAGAGVCNFHLLDIQYTLSFCEQVPSRTSAPDPLCFSALSDSHVLPDPAVILQCEGMLLPVACDAGITDASTILSNNEGVL